MEDPKYSQSLPKVGISYVFVLQNKLFHRWSKDLKRIFWLRMGSLFLEGCRWMLLNWDRQRSWKIQILERTLLLVVFVMRNHQWKEMMERQISSFWVSWWWWWWWNTKEVLSHTRIKYEIQKKGNLPICSASSNGLSMQNLHKFNEDSAQKIWESNLFKKDHIIY